MAHVSYICPPVCTSGLICALQPGSTAPWPCEICHQLNEPANPPPGDWGDAKSPLEWGDLQSSSPWNPPNTPSQWLTPNLPPE
jgi:hypothetical protein